MREIVSPGAPEAVRQIRIGFVGGAGRENTPGEVGTTARGAQVAARGTKVRPKRGAELREGRRRLLGG